MEFMGMGMLEILVIAVVALLVLGPEKLPEYARKFGRFMRQLRKITSGLTQEINQALELDDDDGAGVKKDLKEITQSLEKDAALLRKSLSDGASSLEKTVNEGARGVRESLEKESTEISKTIQENVTITEKGLSEGISETKTNLSAGNPSPEAMVAYKPPSIGEGGTE